MGYYSMTKKHFIELADTIRRSNERREEATLPPMFDSMAIAVLANFCADQNSHFNAQRWLDYIAGKCGRNGGKRTPTADTSDSLMNE